MTVTRNYHQFKSLTELLEADTSATALTPVIRSGSIASSKSQAIPSK